MDFYSGLSKVMTIVLYSGLSKVMTIGQWSEPNTFSLILLSFTLSNILVETRK